MDRRETAQATGHSTGAEGVASDPLARGRLTVVFPRSLRYAVDLGAGRTVLGRAPGTAMVPALVHKTISRQHFAVEWDPKLGMHVGEDLGSRNGSRIDGLASRGWHPLRDGTVVRLGDVVLVFEAAHLLSSPDCADVDRRAMPGEALATRTMRSQVERAAPDISPALILGETGTGKERIAREVHRLSRRTGRFVAVNCATFGDQLVESQLFGHKKGAFTGATEDHEGLFVAAQNGTLFLDEIGELPLSLQPKLLRAIQEGEVRPLGSTADVAVDVRVVAATHRHLAERATDGTFRQDLYARLSLWQIVVPPLRARRVDVLDWIDRLHTMWCEGRSLHHDKPIELSCESAERLVLDDWPENLRGLNRLVHEMGSAAPQALGRSFPPHALLGPRS